MAVKLITLDGLNEFFTQLKLYLTSNFFTKIETNTKLSLKADADNVYTKSEIDNMEIDAYSVSDADSTFATLANTYAKSEVYNKSEVDAALATAYKAKGSIAFANLPLAPTASMLGWVYNIYDDFTTDVRFLEGIGMEYFAGENVVVVELTPADNSEPENPVAATYGYDVLGGFVDTSAFLTTSSNAATASAIQGKTIAVVQSFNSSTGVLTLVSG